MSAYKRDVVVVIKMGAYISWGVYYPNFTVFGPCLTLVTLLTGPMRFEDRFCTSKIGGGCMEGIFKT